MSSSPMEIQKKSEDLVKKTFSKLIQTILLSRIDVPPSQRFVNKSFHCELEESDFIQKNTIDPLIFNRNGLRISFFLDILFDENGQNSLVESWRFVFEQRELDTSTELPKFYKNTIILIRTVYALLRNLPCYTVFRNFSKIRSTSSSLRFQIRPLDIQNLYVPQFPLSQQTKLFQFTPVQSPVGVLRLDLTYREQLKREIEISSQLGLESQFIIKDYKNNFQPLNNMYPSNPISINSGGGGGGLVYQPPSTTTAQPIPTRMNSYPDLQSLNNNSMKNSNQNAFNRPSSNPSSGGGAGSLGIDAYLNYAMLNDPTTTSNNNNNNNNNNIPRTNSNNNISMTNLYSNYNDKYDGGGGGIGIGINKSNPINIVVGGSSQGNSQGSQGSFSSSPFSSSPPFGGGGGGSLKPQSPVYIGPGSGNSPPFHSNPSSLPIKQVSFTSNIQSSSPSNQQPPFSLNQIQGHRNRSTSTPINIVQQQQQQQYQQAQQKSSSGTKSPPIHVSISPFKEPSSLDFYNKKGSSPIGGAGSFNSSSGNPNTTSSSSLKNSSTISQIHGPLLVSNVLVKELKPTNAALELIDYDDPVFAPSNTSSKATESEEISEFVRLCQLAPPLKLFENQQLAQQSQYQQNQFQYLQQLQIGNDIIEMSNLNTLVNNKSQSSSSNNNTTVSPIPIIQNRDNPPSFKATYPPSNWS